VRDPRSVQQTQLPAPNYAILTGPGEAPEPPWRGSRSAPPAVTPLVHSECTTSIYSIVPVRTVSAVPVCIVCTVSVHTVSTVLVYTVSAVPVYIVIAAPVHTVSAVPSAHCSLCTVLCTVLRTVLCALFCVLFCALFSFDCTPFRILLAEILHRMQTLQTCKCIWYCIFY
jgi:hypothetical protein